MKGIFLCLVLQIEVNFIADASINDKQEEKRK